MKLSPASFTQRAGLRAAAACMPAMPTAPFLRSALAIRNAVAAPGGGAFQLAKRRSASTACAAASLMPPTADDGARAAAAAEAASATPPPADIEATCLRCTISALRGEDAEALSDVLLSVGAQSVTLQEHRPPGAPEQAIYEDGGEAQLWELCDAVAHFPLEADVEGTVALAADAVGLPPDPPLLLAVEPMANEAWVEQIKASYVPLQLEQDLWVVPEWAEPEDAAATNIRLQPGVAFGTGEHPTTRLCLRELRALGVEGRLKGAAVMDYGTGSGVLAIAALMYGAREAVGTDVDSLAVKAAQRNGVLNNFEPPALSVYQCGAGLESPEPLAAAGYTPSPPPHGAAPAAGPATGSGVACFDVVVANILRGPLVELCGRLSGYARPGALLLLSGILAEQAPEIVAEYEAAGFGGWTLATDQQWALLRGVKRA